MLVVHKYMHTTIQYGILLLGFGILNLVVGIMSGGVVGQCGIMDNTYPMSLAHGMFRV